MQRLISFPVERLAALGNPKRTSSGNVAELGIGLGVRLRIEIVMEIESVEICRGSIG